MPFENTLSNFRFLRSTNNSREHQKIQYFTYTEKCSSPPDTNFHYFFIIYLRNYKCKERTFNYILNRKTGLVRYTQQKYKNVEASPNAIDAHTKK